MAVNRHFEKYPEGPWDEVVRNRLPSSPARLLYLVQRFQDQSIEWLRLDPSRLLLVFSLSYSGRGDWNENGRCRREIWQLGVSIFHCLQQG